MAISVAELGLSLAAGGLTTLNPCVFPLLPLVLGGALQGHRAAPVAMGLGMASSFAAIGVLIGLAGPALGLDTDVVRMAGGWLLLACAAVMLVPSWGERFTQWMTPLATGAQAASTRLSGGSLASAFGLGSLLGLVWSPCSGPLLASALTLVASEGGGVRGGIILGLFGLGAAIPLVAVAYASRAGFHKARGWVMARIARIKTAFAVLLGLMGLAILTGADKWLEARVLSWLPDAWLRLTVMF
jgi:cytochrome c biogenesis protein CcdA